MRAAALLLATVAVAAVVVIGLRQASEDAPESPKASYDIEQALAQLEGAPEPLAALHRQQSQLVEGGTQAFRERLAELRGHPVVVNVWGSWCGPCRAEFPVFQRAAARNGKRVAFLGIDSQDNEDEAREFLGEFPVPYPSYVDPRGNVAASVDAGPQLPYTVFVDREGEVEIALAKPYETVAELEADIERYLDA